MANGIEVARAYVTIIPRTDGSTNNVIKSIVSPMGKGADSAGKAAGASFAGAMKKVIAAAGVGVAIKKSLEAGGNLQQSFGGLDTLYGDAANAAKNYAKEAYKAGISANTYAEQAVSFGASLKQAYGGDTTKAMQAANTAILDMADNAAKMGTPIESVQAAYQGFAKGQYMLLDNLKLGYGGTKTEMERLLADAEKLSGKEYNIENLGDVYDAIHVIQGELGLTGVAADEAASTFTGSLGAMKAAGENMLASLMLGQDVGPSMQALVESTVTFLAGNLLPAVGNIVASLPTAIGTAISTGLPLIAEQAANLVTALTNGINTKIPELAASLPTMVSNALNSISTLAPQVAAKGLELITNLGNAIVTNAPALASAAASAISSLVGFISENGPKLAAQGGELLGKLASGLISHLPQISAAVAKIGVFLVKNLAKLAVSALKAGANILKGIGSGLASGIGSIIGSAMNKIKSAITRPIESARSTVAGIIRKIKGLFPLSIGKIFSNLKLPHISVSGGSAPFGIGGKGSLPHFSVSWYRKAESEPYLFKSKTIFGAGEGHNDEMLYGRQALLDDIEEASGGSGDTIVNLYYDASDEAKDMVYDIARGLKRYKMAGVF